MHRHASLNRIFRLVWSHVHQAWIAVAETTRGRGKGSRRRLALAAAALVAAQAAQHAQAGPTGGLVTNGAGAITQAGNTTTINQSSQNLSLQWNSFNTSAAETVNFVQPSANALAVNRILDTNATQFFGKLNANGQVWLINPNGVLFGAGAQVNVGGLVASTLDLDEQSGAGAARRFAGNGSGSIVNQGAITTADGGYVAFIGIRVSNQGSIVAPGGRVALGAGSDVTLSFAGNSLLGLQVNQTTLDNLAENGGLIRADGGAVVLSAGARDAVLASAVNNTGIIEAKSVREVNGAIVLDGGQNSLVSNSGTLDASGRAAGNSGGTVKVLGQDVVLGAASRIDVAGDLGGGTALVGGNFLGAGPERNAQNTSVAAGSRIVADAVSAGNGGSVAVWSDDTTHFDGRISARGGAAGGDGGNVETSGKTLKVGTPATVDTLAPRGAAGNWLLDPNDLTIGGFNPGDGDITGQQITQALMTSNVTIKTGAAVTCTGMSGCSAGHAGNGDIILADGSLIGYTSSIEGDYAWVGNTTLTLSAYRNIELRGTANLDATAGTGNMVLRADNTGTGVGTVILGSDSGIYGNGVGYLKIYYNPTSYTAPTNYAALMDSSNSYTLIQYVTPSTYMLVNATASIANKTYDGTTAATIGSIATRRALPTGVTLDTSMATAAFTDKNAGASKATLVSGVVMGGANASQYFLNGLDSSSATISKANLAVTGVGATSKTYDATTSATLSGSAAVTPIGADVVNLGGSASASFADKNAGTGKAVTVTGYTISGLDAGNYNLVQPAGLTATINKANLAVTGVAAVSKTYDAGTAATLSGTATVTAFGSDAVSATGTGVGNFATKDAGVGKSVIVSGYSLTGLDAANYNVVQPSGLTANVGKANLAVSGLAAADKTYDATTAATLAGTAAVTALGSDAVSLSGTASGSFVDKNVGTSKAITIGGLTLAGADAGNYNLVAPAGLTASIAKANLALTGLVASNKTYDGTTAASFSGTATVSAIGADVVAVSGSGSASFADKNAGSGKAVTVSGYTLAGADAGNYTLTMPAGLTAAIARANLAVTGITASGKTYDGTTGATLAGTAAVAAFGSDAVSVGGTGSATFADKNAGVGKVVTVTGFTLGGADANNYNLVQPAGVTATINKANLAVSGLAAADKTYDATTAATLTGTAAVTAFGSDVVNVSGTAAGTFATKNAGAGKAVAISGLTLSGADAGNYNLVAPAGLTASIAKANLALTGVSANNKTYDATTAATLSGSAAVSAFGSDVVSVAGSGVASFADKNAGSGKAVTVSGYMLTGADAGNYNLVLPAGLTAVIARANLAVTGVTASNKTYDGTTAATLAGTASVAAIGSDAVTVGGSASGTFADKNAGASKAVVVTGFALTGADASNYNVVQPAGVTASIGKASLAVSGLAAADKTYDATTAATLTGTAAVTAFGSDVVNVAGTASGAFADKNAGANKAVAISGLTLSGADAGNYNVMAPAGLTASIARADLALTGVSANNKTYDATTAATLSGSAAVSALGSDVVSVAGSGAGAFADKNAGSGKAVTVSGYTLTGADADNYNLIVPTGLTAAIARANLAVTGVSASDKTYDGTTSATLAGTASVAAFGGDAVTVAGSASGTFADKNAGAGKAVSVTGFTLGGVDAANYNVVQPTGVTATIDKANLAIGGLLAVDKVYDGSTAASLSGTASVAPIGADVVALTGTGSGAFADKNAGAAKAVTVTGFALTGADAGNYTVAQPVGLTASIGKADLALTGVTANSKTYDGTTAATLTGNAGVTAIGNDVVSVTGSGAATFADKNAGAGKAVAVGGYALAGADAGNYHLVLPAGLTANIARASVAVSGVTANNRTYDGTTAATLSGTASVAAFGNDAVTVQGNASAAFADRNAGASKAVTVGGYTLAGVDAANYNVVQPAGLTATIGKANLAVNGLAAADKVYDASTAAALTGTASVTAFGNDAVAVGGTGIATFADKNAGANKAVQVSGLTLTGVDAGNYNLVQPAGLAASIGHASLALTGITANGKTYDGTTAATLSGSAGVTAIAGDTVGVSGTGSAAFADKNAGTGKLVTASGYSLTGADAGNYVLAPATLRADIGRASLAVSGVTANGKVYDGGTGATLSGSASVRAFGTDIVTLLGTGSGAFADKNAGTGKTVTVTGYQLGGVDASNYSIVQPVDLVANIGRAQLAVTGITASDKVYDGTTAASLAGSAIVKPLGSDTVSLGGAGVATFADKNAGSAKAVSVGGYMLLGADAANYTLASPAGLRAAITPARLTVTGITASDKAYDGTTAATVSTAAVSLGGKIGADSVSVTSTGTFADAAAGAGKTVNLTNVYGGADVANYAIADQATAQASIAALPVVATQTAQVRDAVAQVQSTILAPQASAQPQALTLSSTISDVAVDAAAPQEPARGPAGHSLIDTRFGAGPGAPSLQIQDGGVQLPPLAQTSAQ